MHETRQRRLKTSDSALNSIQTKLLSLANTNKFFHRQTTIYRAMLATVVQCQWSIIIMIGGVFAIYFQMIACVACIIHTIHEHDEKISSLIMENQLNLLLLAVVAMKVNGGVVVVGDNGAGMCCW